MDKALKIFFKIIKVLTVVTGVLFVIYFWNLDQKLMAWLYTVVNQILIENKIHEGITIA